MLCSLSTLTYRRAVNFNRYRFNVSIFDQEQEGLKFQNRINPDSTYVYSREYGSLGGILLGVLAKKLNFTVNVIEPNTNGRHGHRMENDTFSETVGNRRKRKPQEKSVLSHDFLRS